MRSFLDGAAAVYHHKANGLKPFEYLKFLFEAVPNSTTGPLLSFLPWGDVVPDYCRLPSKP